MSQFKKESIMKPFSRIISVINVTITLFFISTSYAHDAVKNHKKPVANIVAVGEYNVIYTSEELYDSQR